MMRIWVKEWQNSHMIKDTVICDETEDTRTHKIFHALEKACSEFDIAVPIWLDKNVREFKRHSKTKFYQDSFIEALDFDYLEFMIIEE